MKAIATILIAAAFLVMGTSFKLGAQTVVIGHVTAEVVDAVSASLLDVTGFDLNNGNDMSSMSKDVQNDILNLGDIKIKLGSGIAFNVVLNASTLSDANGNAISIEPTGNNFIQGAAQSTGNLTLHLKGRAHVAKGQASGLFQGTYSMVFAFN